jgi:hypothetical protein
VSGRYRFGIAPIAHTFDMSISRDERHEFYGMRLLSRRVAWSKAASEMACRLGHGRMAKVARSATPGGRPLRGAVSAGTVILGELAGHDDR